MELELSKSWLIGDAPRDVEAGHAAGCKTILFRAPNVAPSPAAGEAENVKPDYVVSSLVEALDDIETHTRLQSEHAAATAADSSAHFSADSSAKTQATSRASGDFGRLERIADQILLEIRENKERTSPEFEFSLTKLLAGILQIIAVAIAFLGYFNRGGATNEPFYALMLAAIFLQLLTISMLIMGRQR